MTQKLSPVHPGEVLDEEFPAPSGIAQYRLDEIPVHAP